MSQASTEKSPSTAARFDTPFGRDVLEAFRSEHPAIPARWLYDYRGSQLFELITQVPEYYPTRVERSILRTWAMEIGRRIGTDSVLVEFGSGSSIKTPIVLEALRSTRYVAIDISTTFMQESLKRVAATFPSMEVYGIEADFSTNLELEIQSGATHVGFFPGSTIGNWEPSRAADILRSMRSTLGDDSYLLIGIDRRKDASTLLRAYDDPQGITARFNLNLLDRINRELAGTIPLHRFGHLATWDDRQGRIEMHLVAHETVAFEVAGNAFILRSGQRIHTENSYKYTAREADLLLRVGGWNPIETWEDDEQMFSVVLAKAARASTAP